MKKNDQYQIGDVVLSRSPFPSLYLLLKSGEEEYWSDGCSEYWLVWNLMYSQRHWVGVGDFKSVVCRPDP